MLSMKRNRPKLVAAVDFSPASVAAARWAAKWLIQDHELVLAHALVVPELQGSIARRYPMPDILLANARAGARHRLEGLMHSLGVPDVTIEVGEGKPADVIAEVARSTGADIIVIGKHGEGGRLRGYAGRTADTLVRSAPAAILVANGILSGAPRRIVVPLTYSSITPLIVNWAAKLQRCSGAEVIAVHVVGSAALSHVLSMSSIESGEPPTAEEIDEIFREDRERWEKELVSAGIPAVKVRSEVVFGEVSSAVLATARRYDADLIVMGSHAGPVRRILLGSAASAVVRESETPVLVVVETDQSDPETSISIQQEDEELAEASIGG
jgi:nucleotide-binding universal stress UspA family protein